jgi:hypothetical protein
MHVRRILALATAVLVATSLAGCGIGDRQRQNVTQPDQPIREADEAYADPDFGALEIGDCFRDPYSAADPTSARIETVDCDAAHDSEVVAVIDLAEESAEHPGDQVAYKTAAVRCVEELESYIDADYITSRYDVSWDVPDAYDWDEGATSIVCSAYDGGYEVLTSSIRGSGA